MIQLFSKMLRSHFKHLSIALLVCLIVNKVLASDPPNWEDYGMQMVVPPKLCNNDECPGQCNVDRLTNRWAFVIDTSASMAGVFPKVRLAFQEATQFPTDDFKFATYLFNSQNNERYQDWTEGSIDAFNNTDNWVTHQPHPGVLSFGGRAIRWAITGWAPELDKNTLITGNGVYKTEEKLTVILITDGGFTESCRTNDMTDINNAIEESQQWRLNNGYPRAIITVIGIENLYYRAGGKRPDEECQRDLREIGTRGCGGYFYVRRKERE